MKCTIDQWVSTAQRVLKSKSNSFAKGMARRTLKQFKKTKSVKNVK